MLRNKLMAREAGRADPRLDKGYVRCKRALASRRFRRDDSFIDEYFDILDDEEDDGYDSTICGDPDCFCAV